MDGVRGRPRTGTVADAMRRTRASYHYAIRKVKRNEEHIVSEKVADALLHNKTRDFWSESSRSGTSRTVDDQTEPSCLLIIIGSCIRVYRMMLTRCNV